MISCSMIHWLIGAVWLCSTNASQPLTDSRKRTKISPLAKSNKVVGVGSMPRKSAISSPSSGNARPEKSIIFLPVVVSRHGFRFPSPRGARFPSGPRRRPPAARSPVHAWLPRCLLATRDPRPPRCANGPTLAPAPMTADSQTDWMTVAPSADHGVPQQAAGPDRRAGRDRGAALQLGARPDAGARRQVDADVHPGARGVGDPAPRRASST